MSTFSTAQLAEQLSQRAYLGVSSQDVADVMANIGYQVADSLETGYPVELPFLAQFGFAASGAPTALLTAYFLKNQQARYSTGNQKLASRNFTKCFQYSGHPLARLLIPHIFAELSNAVLCRSCNINVDFGGVFRFTLDRQLRRWTFYFCDSMRRAIHYDEQRPIRAKSAGANSGSRVLNSAVAKDPSRCPRDSYYAFSQLSGTSHCSHPSKRERKPDCKQYCCATSERSQLLREQDNDVANMQDFYDYKDTTQSKLSRDLYDINRKRFPLFTRKVAERAKHQLVERDTSYAAKLEWQLQQTIKDIADRQHLAETRELERSKSLASRKCIACEYDEDIEDRKRRRQTELEQTREQYQKWAENTNVYYVRREIENYNRYRQIQKKYHDYNEQQAENLHHTRTNYFLQGRLASEGALQENTAVLADEDDLKGKLRARARDCLRTQLIYTKEKELASLDVDERREDYINRKQIEIDNAYQQENDRAWKTEKQRALAELLRYYDEAPKLLTIPKQVDMACCMYDSYRRSARFEDLFRSGDLVRDEDNIYSATLKKEYLRLDRLKETLLDREHQVELQRKLFVEKYQRQNALDETRRELIETYDRDIEEKTQRARQERIDSWYNMDEFRFQDRAPREGLCSCEKHTCTLRSGI